MEPLLVHPDPPPPELARLLDLGGYTWKAVADERTARQRDARRRLGRRHRRRSTSDSEAAWALCCGRSARRDVPVEPLLLLSAAAASTSSTCATSSTTTSASTRSTPASSRPGSATCSGGPAPAPSPELVEYGGLVLNLETYQAVIDSQPLDLTYMEYELLKFLAQHPGKVFTRETLLSRVWGYEYYGGARTVDVHIRRLRAKLGEEHAGLIATVRSVGYRFGRQSRWGA